MSLKNINPKIIINLCGLKLIWASAVFGAAHSQLLPCYILTGIFLIWQLLPKNRHVTDIKLLLLAIPIGFVLDTAWQTLNLIQYANGSSMFPFAPLWIVCLWITFSLCFNHSLAWLKKSNKIVILFGLLGSPLSYWFGSRIGAMEYLANPWLVSTILGIAWAVILYFLVSVAKQTKEKLVPINA